ncbi:hypothetical protein B0T14DRAFT_566752 [Immersiella caudata]|uniref:Protein rds1 n=1 Tax=Immersiella caudata TaxID=314043 RepID=A0AA40BZN0_9PEZI|nr:hypothetical protein B0T14DRAFT_566752 [Immersiella caudata]
MPFTPSGGIGTNGSEPVYKVASDFDYQSLTLTLFHEWIELDLFHWGLATFADEEFEEYGINTEDHHLIQHMADQEIGHASVLANMLGPTAPKQYANSLSTEDIPDDELGINAEDPTLDCEAAISQNRSIPLSYPGREVFLHWDLPGKVVGPNNSYVTTTNVKEPKSNVSTWLGDPAVNGIMFMALAYIDLYVTPYNVTAINGHVAVLAVYQAG